MKIYVDITTGEIRRTLNGLPVQQLHFHQNDILALQIVLVDGTDEVTAAQLAGGKTLDVSLNYYPLPSNIIARGEAPTISGDLYTISLDLSASAIGTFLTDKVPASSQSVPTVFEIQLRTVAGSLVETIHQSRALLFRDMNAGANTDEPTVDSGIGGEGGESIGGEGGESLSPEG